MRNLAKSICIPDMRLILRAGLIFISITLISSCGDRVNDEQKPAFSLNDTVLVKAEAKKMFGDKLKFVQTGNFDEDSLQEVIVGIELSEDNSWGIKFTLLETENNHLVKKYESELLDGSFKESLVQKIKFPGYSYELIYYNSQDYYWGSGGGEVFVYLIDFAKTNTFYAHLFAESRKPIELFLSKNISDKELQKFLISTLKKDYPGLRLASEDVSLEF